MKIACLGWGSLIWDPRELNIKRKWFEDGPVLPIEFLRVSKDGRLTLVVDTDDKKSQQVRVLWALMNAKNKNEAIKFLRNREGTSTENIHFVEKENNDSNDKIKSEIQKWLKEKNIDIAIWTGLSWNENCFEGERPNKNQVVEYLAELEGPERQYAEQYIRNTPKQIDTPYRRTIEKKLGWISNCKI